MGISEFTGSDTSYSDLSNSLGQLIFSDVLRGDYLSVVSKEDNSNVGLSAVDASRIARNTVGLFEFNDQEKYIADVDLNGIINAYDASAIARLLVGNVDSLNEHSLSWRFVPKNENSISFFDQSFVSELFNGSQESVNDFEYQLDWIFNPSLIDMNILGNAKEMIDALQDEDEAYVNEVLNVESLSPIKTDFISPEMIGSKIGDVDGDWYTDIVNLSRNIDLDSYQMGISTDEESLILPLTIEGENLIEGIDLYTYYLIHFLITLH